MLSKNQSQPARFWWFKKEEKQHIGRDRSEPLLMRAIYSVMKEGAVEAVINLLGYDMNRLE